MSRRKIVEDLAEVRAQIDHLRSRERELCAALLRAPPTDLFWHSQRDRVGPVRLPDAPALAAPDVLHALPAPKPPQHARPGWPIRREVAAH